MKIISKLSLLALVLAFGLFSQVKAQSDKNDVPEKAEDISPLLIGEELPKISLTDMNGKAQKLKKILGDKSTVLVFYRGGWCPYCNRQLSGLMEVEDKIVEMGYKIVAVSPEDYNNLSSVKEEGKINYELYSDADGAFIEAVGIGFKTPGMVKTYVKSKSRKGETSEILPVPTVMVVDKDGTILFEYISPNYKKRISPEMLLAVIKTIEK